MLRVIDGDNLLGTWPGRSRSDEDKRALVGQIELLTRREGRRIVIVFDGSPPPGSALGADVLYAGPGRTADAVILELLRHESERTGWTVVTADRSLADRCRFLGAGVEPVRAFRARLHGDDTEREPGGPS